MAEGFLQANQENDLEIAGYSVFNHLLQTSLIQDTKRDNFGNITHCRMHDLVHDLACSVSGSRSANLIDSRNDTNKVRYLNLESNELYCISKERAKYLRTLIFSGKVVANFFSGFNCLHALTLADSDTEELPIGIDKQVHLRFLDISSTRIKYLPDSICKLSNLQTLIVPKTLEKLPRTIIELLNLKHLHIYSMMLPPWMGKLTSLRTLPYYNVDHYPGCRIGELGNLKNLKGKLSIENLERVNNKEEATQADMYGKRNISKLVLVWDKSRRGETNDESVLEGLQPHPNLKSLEIDGYRGRNFPSWTMRMAVYDVVEGRLVGLTNLIEIKLHHCHQCKEVPSLGHLPRLKFLEINDLQYLQSIGPSFYGLEDCNPSSRTAFPALEKLSLSELRYLSEWADVVSRVVAFPCLEDLEIISCPQLKGAPTHFPCLKRLRIYQMANDSCLKNICTNTSHLQQLEINTDWGTTCLPDELFVKNQELSYLNIRSCSKLTGLVLYLRGGGSSLQELNLYDCPNLKELPEDLSTLQSLQRLQIRNCPGLKSFGQCQGLTSLRELEITNFGGLIDFPFEFLESCASSLETLWLHGLESWDTVMNLPISLGRLCDLQISGLSKSWDVVSLNNILKCILYENRSLVSLNIGGNEDWESLPDQVQHLTALQTLILTNFGFEALPEWIGKISSLEFLSVWNCKRLRRMPSKEAMQRRTKLFIHNCPLLADEEHSATSPISQQR